MDELSCSNCASPWSFVDHLMRRLNCTHINPGGDTVMTMQGAQPCSVAPFRRGLMSQRIRTEAWSMSALVIPAALGNTSRDGDIGKEAPNLSRPRLSTSTLRPELLWLLYNLRLMRNVKVRFLISSGSFLSTSPQPTASCSDQHHVQPSSPLILVAARACISKSIRC
jgi:hypothetical protein